MERQQVGYVVTNVMHYISLTSEVCYQGVRQNFPDALEEYFAAIFR
jgi:hypothetical protein